MGRKSQIPEGLDPYKVILFGDCLKKHRGKGVYVDGCPPLEPHPLWAIVDRKDQSGMDDDFRARMAREHAPFQAHMEKLYKEHTEKHKK